MTEAEWLASEDPAAMLEFLQGDAIYEGRMGHLTRAQGNRKLRLFACACCRKNAMLPETWVADLDFSLHDLMERPCEECHSKATQADLLRDIFGNLFRPVTLQYDPEDRDLYERKLVRDDGKQTIWRQTGILTWNNGTIPHLAEAAYEERTPDGFLDPARLAVLADALEEAGCCDTREPIVTTNPSAMSTAALEVGASEEIIGYRTVPNPILAHLRGPGPHACGCWVIDLMLGKE